MIDVIVVGLHLRWAGVWQRPNHVLSRLRRHARVVVVEEQLQATEDTVRVREADGITIVTPERIEPRAGVDQETIELVRSLVRSRRVLLWLYSPSFTALAEAMPDAPLVYDKMDELVAFKGADRSLAAQEMGVCARASYVFAGGRSLWCSVEDRVRAGGAYPSGVDVQSYAVAARSVAAAKPANGRPAFGYIGVIDERLDLDLIAFVARERPDAILMMVGPVTKINSDDLPRAENITYPGVLSYDRLPALLATFTVALMPFAINEATRYISPTKTLEYLAAERPVVSTAVPDVVADFGDIVYIASDGPGFVAAIALAERGDEGRRRAGALRASATTWDAVVDRMVDALATVGLTFSR